MGARSAPKATSAALDVEDSALDLTLRYVPPAAVNRARFVLWTRRLALDGEQGDLAGVRGDVTTLAWIRDRLVLPDAKAQDLDDRLRHLRAVAEAGEGGVARSLAPLLRRAVSG